MDLFKHPRQDMSDDEREDDDESEKEENNPGQFASIAITKYSMILLLHFYCNYGIFLLLLHFCYNFSISFR